MTDHNMKQLTNLLHHNYTADTSNNYLQIVCSTTGNIMAAESHAGFIISTLSGQIAFNCYE